MEIEYHLTETDILELARYRLRNIPKRRNPILVRRLAYFVGFTLMALGSIIFVRDIILPLVFLGLGIFSLLFYPLIFNWLIKRRVAAAYSVESKRATLAKRTLRATSEGIEEKSSLGESLVKWDAIDKIDVTPDYVIISVLADPIMIIPKKCVDKGDFEGFIRECREYFKGHAK